MNAKSIHRFPAAKSCQYGGGDTVKNELEIHECGDRCITFGKTDYSIIFLLLECGMMSRGKMPHPRSLAGIAATGGSLATIGNTFPEAADGCKRAAGCPARVR